MTWKDTFAAAIGRPRAIEGEQMVISDGLMASMVRPGVGGVYFLPVDEIIRTKGWGVYKDMLHDDQIKACLRFKKILIHGRTWEVQANKEGGDQAVKVADFVEWSLKRLDFNRMFEEALTCLEFGYSMGELVWERDQYDGSQMVCLKKIGHRDPQRLYLEMDWHGNYTGVRQIALGQNILLGPEKTWLYSYNKRFGDLYGESDLRACYRNWWAKKFIMNFWNVFLERMGQPMLAMKYPQGASDQLKETLKSILKNLSSKTEILIPEGVQIDLVEAHRAGTATYDEALKFHNNSIARSLLMVSLFGTGGENNQTRGADSMSFLQLRMIFKMADMLAQDMIVSFMEQVVKPLVEFNFDGDIDKLMPTFIWQDYGQYAAMQIADEIRQLHAVGILDMDQSDVNYVRSILGMPLRDADENPDKVQRPAPVPPPGNGAPPPSAPQGNDRAGKAGSSAVAGETTGDLNPSPPKQS